MHKSKSRKLGLAAAISMLIGTVIGAGIFFRNNDIFNITNYSAVSTGIAWILGSIISLTAAISFSEIGRTNTEKNTTGELLWTKKYSNNFLSKGFGTIRTVFYYNIYIVILSFLISKFFFDALDTLSLVDANKISPIIHLIIGLFFGISLLLSQYFSEKFMSITQSATTIIKVIPLFVVVIAGLIFFNTHNYSPDSKMLIDHNGKPGQNLFKHGTSFDFSKMIAAIPLTLFTYDAFTSISSTQGRIKNGKKRMPLLIFFSMLFVIVLYLSLTIIQLLRGTGSISDTLNDFLPKGTAKYITFSVLILITISVFGTVNGISYISFKNIENLIKDKRIWIPYYQKDKQKLWSLIYVLSIVFILFIITIIYGLFISLLKKEGAFENSSILINQASISSTLFSFLLY
ncbi:MAG: amino acid permease, partial [Mollicutes bacterium PWAP]|nr:amino acid permease [Mollicutes bacterium PWAP]